MKDYVAFRLEDGQAVVVEVDEGEHERGLSRVSRRTDGIVAESSQRLEEMIDVIRPATDTILDRFRSMAAGPDSITLEFGLKLTLSAGAVIAASTAEGNFKVALTWRRDESA